MPTAFFSLISSGIFYLAAAFLYIVAFFRENSRFEKAAFTLIRLGFGSASVYLAAEAWTHGFSFPILNFSHVLVFFSWALAFLYLIPLARLQTQSFGLILAPALFMLNLIAVIHASDPAYHVDVKIYFVLHIIFAFFAYASFTLSFTAALLYLTQHNELKRRHAGTFYHKLPNLEALDQLTYQPIIFGIILLVCAVAVGMLWSRDTYGQVWMNDPKTFLTFIDIGLYGFLISLRTATNMRNSRIALLSLLVFVFMIGSFVGGRYLNGKHSDRAFSADAVPRGSVSALTRPLGTASGEAT